MSRQPRLDTKPVRCLYATSPAQRPHCQVDATIARDGVNLCTDCDQRRSTLGKGAAAHPLPPQPPIDTLDWILQSDQQLRQAHTELAAAVFHARAHGHPWSAIAATLNITRQAAQQRFTHAQTSRR